MKTLIFEENSGLRKLLSEEVKKRDGDPVEIYSQSKLERALSQESLLSENFLIVSDKGKRDIIESYKRLPVEVVYYEGEELEKSFDIESLEFRRFWVAYNTAKRSLLKRGKSSNAEVNNGLDLLCIGSSTGGFPVVQEVLSSLMVRNTYVVLAQHVSASMSEGLVGSLEKKVNCPVFYVTETQQLKDAGIYFLQGGKDFEFQEKYGNLYIAPKMNLDGVYHPSFNVLTQSLTQVSARKGAVLIFSGLGEDGAANLSALRKKGYEVVIQDPQYCVAPGMPRAALATGAVSKVLGPEALHQFVLKGVA